MRARSGDGATKIGVHSASGPILLDYHRISERTCEALTSPESETLIFSCLLLSKTPGVVSLEFYLLLSIKSSDITPRVTLLLSYFLFSSSLSALVSRSRLLPRPSSDIHLSAYVSLLPYR
jgi:hypothetical protein